MKKSQDLNRNKMKISRRQLFKRIGYAALFGLLSKRALTKERPVLTIPPLIDVGKGRPVRLDFRPAQTQFNIGKLVEVWGANGHYLAPTVRVKSGDFVKLTCHNQLPQALSINIQGLMTSSEVIGSTHQQIAPQENWSPIIPINQPACSAWYHANTMLNSAFQLYRGIAGLWIIEDNESYKTTLPNKYGINDIPLILQDQLINQNGIQALDNKAVQFFGKRLFVNGQENPFIEVARGWVRLRVVNASLSRQYDLQLDNGKPLYVLANGIDTFSELKESSVVHLAPSQRVELLIDLSEEETVSLISGGKRGFFYDIEQLFQNNDELKDNVVLEMRAVGLPSALQTKPVIPMRTKEQVDEKIAQERHFHLRPFDFLINKQRFDPKRIDFTAKKGSTERWSVISNEAIRFTLQGAKFFVKGEEEGEIWQDSVWLEKDKETILFVKFEHTAPSHLPFTFGVSDFMLRDRGCIGQFTVE